MKTELAGKGLGAESPVEFQEHETASPDGEGVSLLQGPKDLAVSETLCFFSSQRQSCVRLTSKRRSLRSASIPARLPSASSEQLGTFRIIISRHDFND